MKKLQTKQINFYTVLLQIKRLAPKDLQTIDEMQSIVDEIIPKLKVASGSFYDLYEKSEAIRADFVAKKISEEEANAKLKELTNEISEYESLNKETMSEVDFENASANTLFQIFEKSGKNWFVNLEQYINFRKDLVEMNNHKEEEPKKAKK